MLSFLNNVRKSMLRGIWNKYKLQLSVSLIFNGLWLLFFVINPFAFTNPYTYTSVMSIVPFTLLPALSTTCIMICGEIDLSFPSIMALASWVLTVSWYAMGPNILGLIFALLVGLIAGLLNGIIITKGRIPSMIATLGMMFFWRGVVMVGTQGYGIPLMAFRGALLYNLFVGRIGSIPLQMIWAIVIALFLWILLNRHLLGQYVLLTGDNREAAKMMGIDTDKIIIAVFMLQGVIVSFAGIVATLELLTFWPSLGDAYLMKSIAAVVIGGTSIYGGSGTIFGTFLGGLILGLIELGLLSSGVSGFWTNLVYGLIIITALIVQAIIRRMEFKRELKEKLTET